MKPYYHKFMKMKIKKRKRINAFWKKIFGHSYFTNVNILTKRPEIGQIEIITEKGEKENEIL